MQSNIIFYSANPKIAKDSYWDMQLLKDILAKHPFKNLPNNGAIIIIPGAYQAEYIDEINKFLKDFQWVLLFITSDEESKFPVSKIKHKNIKIWVQYPKKGKHDKYGKLPLGYTTETRKNLKFTEKSLNLFYSGQKSHERRELCSKALEVVKEKIDSVFITDTSGFAQGLDPKAYMAAMSEAKVAPAPSGPVSADSFRVYEALEAGAVPIADNESPGGDHDYWNYLFNSEVFPFDSISDYDNLYGYAKDLISKYPLINLKVQAWWIKKKRDLMWQFIEQIEQMSGGTIKERGFGVTAIIPVSPIKSHPSISILSQTVNSIRHHLPEAEIIITFDGVRKEQDSMRENYYESIREALFLCNTKWDAIPIIFDEHTHQVGMARVALEEVKTPTILYMEQDTPIVTDLEIEWEKLIADITLCKANVIRFHYEANIPEPHKYLMVGYPENRLLKTVQWSQRPHISSTSFYKYILEKNFSKNAKCFIEDKLHGVIQKDYAEMGFRGWDLWKLFIYYPDDRNIKRSLNLDGREGGAKYDDTQVF